MNISLDLHGVITADPIGFEEYAKSLVKSGHKVYILTGASYTDAISELAELRFNLNYVTEILSVTDYLLEKEVPWEYDQYDRPSFHESVWWGCKGSIARKKKIDLHIDDSIDFEKHFTTSFLLYSGGK